MVTKRNADQDRLVPRPSDAPLDDDGVRRQLAKLYGESLFGAWPELEHQVQVPRRKRRVKVWFWRALVLVSLALALWGGNTLFRPGMTTKDDALRDNYAAALQSFLDDGALAQAAQFLPLVYDQGADGKGKLVRPDDKHLDLVVFAEAALYRYFDADPARLSRIRPYLEGGKPLAPLRQVATFTLESREERAAQLPALERLWNELPNNNELEYLRATALDFRGDRAEASAAWSRSAKLGPAWLSHRFEQAQFEAAHGDSVAAKKVGSQIVRVDPDSHWAKLAAATFALPSASAVHFEAAVPVITPVEAFFEKLQQSLEAARAGESAKAKELLLGATAAIHEQPPFLFDAFDWLVLSKQTALARELVNLPQWPGDSEIAKAKQERLTTVRANPSP